MDNHPGHPNTPLIGSHSMKILNFKELFVDVKGIEAMANTIYLCIWESGRHGGKFGRKNILGKFRWCKDNWLGKNHR